GALELVTSARRARPVASPDYKSPGEMITHALVVSRGHHGDQADKAEEQRVNDQHDAANEVLGHAGRSPILADDADSEQLHSEGLSVMAVRPETPVPEVDRQRDARRHQPAETVQE